MNNLLIKFQNINFTLNYSQNDSNYEGNISTV